MVLCRWQGQSTLCHGCLKPWVWNCLPGICIHSFNRTFWITYHTYIQMTRCHCFDEIGGFVERAYWITHDKTWASFARALQWHGNHISLWREGQTQTRLSPFDWKIGPHLCPRRLCNWEVPSTMPIQVPPITPKGSHGEDAVFWFKYYSFQIYNGQSMSRLGWQGRQ